MNKKVGAGDTARNLFLRAQRRITYRNLSSEIFGAQRLATDQKILPALDAVSSQTTGKYGNAASPRSLLCPTSTAIKPSGVRWSSASGQPGFLWAWLKRHALANYCPKDLSELHTTARNKLKSAQKHPSIIVACWMQATLW